MPERLKILYFSAVVNMTERKDATWRPKIGMFPKEAVLVRLQIQIRLFGTRILVHSPIQNTMQRFTADRCLWHIYKLVLIPVSPLLSFPCTCACQCLQTLSDAVVWIHFAEFEVDGAVEFLVTSPPPVITFNYLTVTSKFALLWGIDFAGKASMYSCDLRQQIPKVPLPLLCVIEISYH